jgi:ABC-type branched-subunit amino acid transport system ATPase component
MSVGEHVETSGERLRSSAEIIDELVDRETELHQRALTAMGLGASASGAEPFGAVLRGGLGWRPLVALCGLSGVAFLPLFVFGLYAADIAHSIRSSVAGIPNFLELWSLGIGLGAVLAAAGSVWRSPRRAAIAIWAAVVLGLSTLALAFVAATLTTLVVALVSGLCGGAVFAMVGPLLFDVHPPGARVRAFILAGAAMVGGMVGAGVIDMLARGVLGLTWRGAFVVVAGLVEVSALFAGVVLRDPGVGTWDIDRIRELVDPDLPPRTADEESSTFLESSRRLLAVPSVRLGVSVASAAGIFVFPFPNAVLGFLGGRGNLGSSARLVVLTALWGVGLVAVLLLAGPGAAGAGGDPTRLARLAGRGAVIATIALCASVAVPWFALSVVLLAVAFAGLSLLMPIVALLTLGAVHPDNRSHMGGLLTIVFGSGGLGGAFLFASVQPRFGVGGTIVAMALPALGAAGGLLRAGPIAADDRAKAVKAVVEEEELRKLQRSGRHLPLLSCRRIDFAYGSVQVLFDVDFTVDDGEMAALLGTNGAGKSTLLRVISGLGFPVSGRVHYAGAEITYIEPERRVGLGITQIPGGRAVFGDLSVLDNLRAYGYVHRRDRHRVEGGIETAFDVFPSLAARREQLASTLSGGEQQMLALSKVYLLRPRLLLIDELSLGLAPIVVASLLDMVRAINAAGTAVVLVEQSVNIALSLVDHAYFMERGEMRFDGQSRDLLGRDDLLRSVFLHGAGEMASAAAHPQAPGGRR